MSETSNPYIAGSPITGPEMFFGREDVFKFVRQTLTGQHRDHVLVLYGQRRTGKTSVLYQMSRHLGERYVCIFIDLHGLALNGLNGFLWELANHISRALRRDYQITLPPLERAAFQDEPRSAFEIAFLDSVWAAIGDRHLLLMLDEAIRLEEQVQAGKLEAHVFEYLRHLMQHHPRLNFLFSLGSGLEEMQKEYAFLFNVALYKKISFLDRDSAVALITEPVKGSCPFQPAAVERILEVTSGHPYFTQLICHSLFNRCQGTGGVTLEDVELVLDEAVERGLAVLKHVWEESTPAEKAVLAGLVSAYGSAGPDRQRREAGTAEIIQTWAERGVTFPESEAARAVRSLMARDVITGEENYAFTVDLMRLWVQKFRRLEWVKEEIEGATQVWARREQERVLIDRQRDLEIQEQLDREQALARQPGQPVSEGAAARETRVGKGILGNSLGLPVVAILALVVLFGIVYFASGRLGLLPASPSQQVNPVEPPAGGSSVILGGEAAQVSDLAMLGGYVWAATEGGLVRWSADGTYTRYPTDVLGLDCMNAMVARPEDNTLWLGCGGVAAARLEGDELVSIGYYNRDDGLETGIVRAMAIDPNGVVWAAGAPDEGDNPPPLSAFDEQSGDQPWQPAEAINNQLSAVFAGSSDAINISSIFIDSAGIIWLGLRDAGIVSVNEENATLFTEEQGVGISGEADRRIRQLLVDKNGTAWAAASGQGLLRLSEGDQVWETIEVVSGKTPISSVAEFTDGSLWAGGDRLVLRSDDGGATWTQVGTSEGLGSDIGALLQDEAGQVWAGAYDGGVSVWDGQQWRALQK